MITKLFNTMEEKAMLRKIALAIICCLGCLLAGAHVQESKAVEGQPADVPSCAKCHVCKNPSALEPCLVDCPRVFLGHKTGAALAPEAGPEEIMLNELENLYEPVKFNHKIHAEMADMCRGCDACHHYTPSEAFHPPCKECHNPELAHEHIRQPGLKGAYHRQCMGCHREWSNETQCEVCHAMKANKEKQGPDYVTPHYRPCSEPNKKTYTTAAENGAYVTFFHSNHAHVYNLKCNDCHQDDSCTRCHYQGEKPLAVVAAAADAMHHKCSACHDINTPTECSSCHGAAKKETFDHGQAAGLTLDENHVELECSDCHANFAKPVCTECHDDKKYPDERPGELVKLKTAALKVEETEPEVAAWQTAPKSVLERQRLAPRSRMLE